MVGPEEGLHVSTLMNDRLDNNECGLASFARKIIIKNITNIADEKMTLIILTVR